MSNSKSCGAPPPIEDTDLLGAGGIDRGEVQRHLNRLGHHPDTGREQAAPQQIQRPLEYARDRIIRKRGKPIRSCSEETVDCCTNRLKRGRRNDIANSGRRNSALTISSAATDQGRRTRTQRHRRAWGDGARCRNPSGAAATGRTSATGRHGRHHRNAVVAPRAHRSRRRNAATRSRNTRRALGVTRGT